MSRSGDETGIPSWAETLSKVEPLIVRVLAGNSQGTAFAIGVSTNDGGSHTMFATARHVVRDVLGNDESLDMVAADGSLISTLTSGPVRVYLVGPPECDTALIAVPTKKPLFHQDALQPMPLETMLRRGVPLGWLGYPGLVAPELCFFHGVVAGHMERPPIYLVDGVAINGVSGGPAFDQSGLLVGLISAYVPNQLEPGLTLPGLMIVVPLNLVRLWMQDLFRATVRHRDTSCQGPG